MTSLADLVSQMLEGGVAHTIVIQTIRVWEAREIPAEKSTPQSRIDKIRAYDRDRKARAKNKIPDGNPPEKTTEIPGGILLPSLSNNGMEKEVKTPLPPKPKTEIPAESAHWAIERWNEVAKANGLAPVQSRNAERIRATQARLKECGGREGWDAALELMTQSPGLLGNNDRGWRMDFDAFTSKKKFTKLMEGGYANWKPRDESNSSGAGVSAALAKFRRLHEGGSQDADEQEPSLWGNGFAESPGSDETDSGFQDHAAASGMGRR